MDEPDQIPATVDAGDASSATVPPPPPPTGARRAPRTRSTIAVVAGVLAVFGLVAGGVSLWAGRTALDSDEMARIVTDAVTQPDVADAIADRIVNDVAQALGLRDAVLEYVPDLLDSRVETFLDGIRLFVAEELSEFIQSDRANAAIESAVRLAHSQLLDLLQGDGLVDGIAVEEGSVKLNLLPLVSRALGLIQDVGLLGDVEVPEFDRAGDPAEQRAELEAALGRDLPEEFGEVTVYESEALAEAGAAVERAQEALIIAKRAVWLTLIIGAVMTAVSIWLATRRWRAAVIIAASTVGLFLFVRWAAAVAARRLPDAIREPGGKRAAEEVLGDLVQSLTRVTILYLVVGAAVIVASVVVQRRARRDVAPPPAPEPAPV